MTISSRRKRFTRSDCEFLERNGLLKGPYELIEGDIIVSMPQKNAHRLCVIRLVAWLVQILSADMVGTQATVYINEANLPEPDAFVLNRELPASQSYPAPADVAFIAEVADTTLSDDLGSKALLYAAAEIAEYWVFDISRRCLIVHRQPSREGYRDVFTREEDEMQALLARPDAPVRIGDLLPPFVDEAAPERY